VALNETLCGLELRENQFDIVSLKITRGACYITKGLL